MNDVCRVLLVEDDPGDAHLVRQALCATHDGRFDIACAGTLAEAQQELRERAPDVLLLDLSLPDSTGLDTVRAVRLAAGNLPLIVLTGHDDTAFALQTLDAGAQDYLVKGSFNGGDLVRAMRHAISRNRLEAHNRLLATALDAVSHGVVVTDTESRIEWINPAFAAITGYSSGECLGQRPAELLNSGRHEQTVYDAIRQAITSGNTWRGELISRRKDGKLFDEEVVITPVNDAAGRIRHFVAVTQDISERKRMEAELRALATTDTLTGLPNRRQFMVCLDAEHARVQRLRTISTAVLMLDLDRFKRVNDRYGHATGDALLRHFATIVSDAMRKIDTAGRVGGEEFALILPGADANAAYSFAERLRQIVATTPLDLDGKHIRITVSIGIAVIREDDTDSDAVLIRADQALYRAKEAGRNRVEFADGELPSDGKPA